jgi:hypothetical protein
MTVLIKLDELPANGKSSIFPLFYSAALNTPASCLDSATFCFPRDLLFRHHSFRRAFASAPLFIPERILPKKLISERITH